MTVKISVKDDENSQPGFPDSSGTLPSAFFERLRDEYGFTGPYTIVKDYVRHHRRRTQ